MELSILYQINLGKTFKSVIDDIANFQFYIRLTQYKYVYQVLKVLELSILYQINNSIAPTVYGLERITFNSIVD